MATVVVSGSTDPFVCGMPSNNPYYWDPDDDLLWVFYVEAGVLKCLYGTSLGSLSATNTNGGSGNLSGIINDGKSYSLVFGTYGGTKYVWMLTNTGSTSEWVWVRWERTSGGLGTPTIITEDLASRNGMSRLAHDYGSEVVTTLYGSSEQDVTDRAHRLIGAGMTGNAGAGGWTALGGGITFADIGFFECGRVVKLTDGYLAFGLSLGNTADPSHAFETAAASLPFASTATEVTGTGGAAFDDGGYALGTSHVGHADDAQTDDATYWVAYVRAAGETGANFGRVCLRRRGNTVAGTWSTQTADILGGGKAWAITLTTYDGINLLLTYVKDVAGTRDTAIYYRTYNVATDTWSSETKLADLQASHTFERMATTWRAGNGKVLVGWSELNTTYDLVLGEVVIGSRLLRTMQQNGMAL
ncbi:MAG: hypothetical protein IPM64_18010 [Phycisphaerales bacterium]|nr:hypothetical protein [Phycisphaerales bacterium]